MNKILVVMVALLLLAGCAQQQSEKTTTATKAAASQPEPEVPEVIEVAEKDSTVLSDEIQNAINAGLTPGVKGIIPLAYAVLDYGEAFTFGVGLQNIRNKEDRFQVNVTFKKAHDRMMNPITVNEATMESWLLTNLEEFTLAPGEKKTVSFVIRVGDIKSGVKPSPGSYIFSVKTLTAEWGYFVNKDYLGEKELAIKVE